ncbi:MAG: helix-turn-helix domain-containing protein [Gemmatimonadales bacterium]
MTVRDRPKTRTCTVALPFCGVHLRGQRPLPAAYPRELHTLGDHLRKRRLDLGLLQKQVAQRLGVNDNTVTNWELGRSEPGLRFIPRILELLGYTPFDNQRDSLPIPERLKVYRRIHGLSQGAVAARLGIDPSTLARWESGRSRPDKKHSERIEAFLATP